MRSMHTLNPSNPTKTIDIDFIATSIIVNNPTGSPIYLRVGAPDIPTQTNANIIVPAATNQSYPVNGRSFGAAIGDTALITSGSVSTSGLFNTVLITLIDETEQIPSYGSLSFASLSLSNLTNGPVIFASGTVSSPFDLGAWGGMIVYVLMAPGSGQGTLLLQTSSDNLNWYKVAEWGLWPNIPVILNVPRIQRYYRLTFVATTIPGEPALSGVYAVRASLAEILQLSYTPVGAAISVPFNVVPIGETNKIFVTAGFAAVTVGINATAGDDAELIIEASDNPAGPWRLVSYREQNITGFFNSIYLSLGMLDMFVRVRLLEISTVAITATLKMSITAEPDLSGMLQKIWSALGDIGQPVAVNQSIYHVLEQNRAWLFNIDTKLALIDASLNDIEAVDEVRLPNIDTKLADTNVHLTNIDASLNDIEAVEEVRLPSIDARLADTNVHLTNLVNYPITTAQILSNPFTIPGGGVWMNTGLDLTANGFLQSISWSWVVKGMLIGLNRILFGIGTPAVVVSQLYGSSLDTFTGTTNHVFYGPNNGGFKLPAAGNTRVWLFADSTDVRLMANISYR